MKRGNLILILSIVFLVNFVSAETTISTNATYFVSRFHSPDSVEGVLFFSEANKTL